MVQFPNFVFIVALSRCQNSKLTRLSYSLQRDYKGIWIYKVCIYLLSLKPDSSLLKKILNLQNYFNFHVCLSLRRHPACCRPSLCWVFPSCPTLQFLQSHHKMSLIKVACYVLRVKNLQVPRSKANLSYVHYIIRQVEAQLHILKLTTVFHCLPSVDPKRLP